MNAETDAYEELVRKLRGDSLDSLQLLSSLTDNPVCSVQIDASVPCVTVIWKRYVTSNQLRYVHENILTLLRDNGLKAVLGDDTALPTIHAEDQRWIVENWMPRAKAAGLIAAANLKPAAPWGQATVSEVQAVLSKHMLVRSFDDWMNAQQWLRDAANDF